MMGRGKSRSDFVAADVVSPARNDIPAPPMSTSSPGVLEKGLAATGLQKAEGGKASAEYYTKYLAEQVYCQMAAGSIRSFVEKVDISPVVISAQYNLTNENKNTPGVRGALNVAAGFYRRSLRNKLTLSSAGIDPAVVSYVEKFASFDEPMAQLYESYSASLKSESERINSVGKVRDDFVAAQEASLISGFESKFGIKLPTRQELRESVMKAASEESRQFIEKKTPQDMAADLLGKSFNNVGGLGSWAVEAGEYAFGRVTSSYPGPGIAVVDLEAQFKGSRSGHPGLVRVRILYVKDPAQNLFWPVITQDLAAR